MDRIKPKQISNCLDTVSAQEVSGVKQFSAPQVFLGQPQSVVITGGFIYWAANADQLDDFGNSRLSMENGTLVLEFFDGQWTRL
jgi:hypothetical protein